MTTSTTYTKNLQDILNKLENTLKAQNIHHTTSNQINKSQSFLELISDLLEHIKVSSKSKKTRTELSIHLFQLLLDLNKKFSFISSENQLTCDNTKNLSTLILEAFHILNNFYRQTLPPSTPYEIEKLASNFLTAAIESRYPDTEMMFEFFRMAFNFIRTSLGNNKLSTISKNDLEQSLQLLHISDPCKYETSESFNILQDFLINPTFDHVPSSHVPLLKRIIISTMMNFFNWAVISDSVYTIPNHHIFLWIIHPKGGLSQWLSLTSSESYYDRICHYISKWTNGSYPPDLVVSMKLFCIKFQNSQLNEWISQVCSLVQFVENHNIDTINNVIKNHSEMILYKILRNFSIDKYTFIHSWKWIHIMNHFIVAYDGKAFLDSALDIWKSMNPYSIKIVMDAYIPMNITWCIGHIYWNILSDINDHIDVSMCHINEPLHTIDDKYINWYLCKIMSFISTDRVKPLTLHKYSWIIMNAISLLPLEYHQRHQTLDWLILPLCQFIHQNHRESINISHLYTFHRICKMTKFLSITSQPDDNSKIYHLIHIWLDMIDQHHVIDNMVLIVQHCHEWISHLGQTHLLCNLILCGIKREKYPFVMLVILHSLTYSDDIDSTVSILKPLFLSHKKSLFSLSWNHLSFISQLNSDQSISRFLTIMHKITLEDCFPYELKTAVWRQTLSNMFILCFDINEKYLFLYFALLYDINLCIQLIQSTDVDGLIILMIKLVLHYMNALSLFDDKIDDYLIQSCSMLSTNSQSQIESESLTIFARQNLVNHLLYQTLAHGHWNRSLKLISTLCNCKELSIHLAEYKELYRHIMNRLYYDLNINVTRSVLPLFAAISVPIEQKEHVSAYSQQISIQMRLFISKDSADHSSIEDHIKRCNYSETKDHHVLLSAIAVHSLLCIVSEEWYLVKDQNELTAHYSTITILGCLLQCYSLLKRNIQHKVEHISMPFVALKLTMLFRDVCWFISYIYSILGSFKETIYYYKQGNHSIRKIKNITNQENLQNYYDTWYQCLWNDIELGSSIIAVSTHTSDHRVLIHPIITKLMQVYSLIFNTRNCDEYENIMNLDSPSVDREILCTWKSMIQNHLGSLGKDFSNHPDKISHLKKLGCQDEMALFLVSSMEPSRINIKQFLNFLDLNITSIRPCIIKRVISKLLLHDQFPWNEKTLTVELIDRMIGISFSRKLSLCYPRVVESPLSSYNYCFIHCTLLSDHDDILVLSRREGNEYIDIIMIDIHNYPEKHFRKEFQNLMSKNKETTKHSTSHDIDKSLWWEARNQLNQEFHLLLETMEQSWLGIFVYWFLPICHVDTMERKIMINAIEKLLYPKKLSSLEKSCLLYIGAIFQSRKDDLTVLWLLNCWIEWVTRTLSMITIPLILQENTRNRGYLIDQILVHISNCFNNNNENPFIATNKNSICTTNADNPRTVAMFICDELQYIPWESLPTLKSNFNVTGHSVATGFCRLSCMKAFHFAMSTISKQSCINTAKNKVLYIINPDGDLNSTEKLFVPVFSKKFGCGKGFVGTREAPLSLESSIDLATYTLYIYMGHGTGEQYVSPSKMQHNTKNLPIVFLMGCSSGSFQYRGNFDQDSIVLEYLSKNSPAIVATLWDVTDKDIDRFTMACLERWGVLDNIDKKDNTEKLSLGSAVHESRSKCLLQGIVGSAPVVYGLGHLLY